MGKVKSKKKKLKTVPEVDKPLDTGERRDPTDGQWWRDFRLDDVRNRPAQRLKKGRVRISGSAYHDSPKVTPVELGECSQRLEEIKSVLAPRESQISYSKGEPSPVFENFSELKFEQVFQTLAETS